MKKGKGQTWRYVSIVIQARGNGGIGVVGGGGKWLDLEYTLKVLLTLLTDGLAVES